MSQPPLSTKLAVLLHADIVGSTTLVQADETRAHRQFQETFGLLAEAVSSHGGKTHEIRGDALVAEFEKVSDAVGASIDFQMENTENPQVRIGIAMGEVIVADGTVTGEGIVMAQRLEQIAQPAGICVQAAAYATIPSHKGIDFFDSGNHQLKGFKEPVQVFSSIKLDEHAVNTGNTTDSHTLSIAVMPFNNPGGNTEDDYFGDGIAEDITTELSRFKNLYVCARQSAFTFKGKTDDIRTIGKKLEANYIVEGSIRKAGNRVRISAQLVNANSGTHVWAENYDRDLDDIFAVQDDVVSSVVAQLGLNLRQEAMLFARNRPTDNLSAYDSLLRARSAWWRGDWNEGFRYTQAALEADPSYSQAHAWLALQYAYQTYGRSLALSDDEISLGAKSHAEKALELDDQDPFVHMAASMAFGFVPVPDKHRGLRHIDISFAMNPHDFDVLYCRAYHLAWSERVEQALESLVSLEKLNPLAGFMLGECYADVYYLMKRYQDCIDCYRGRGEAPNQVKVLMAASYAQLGKLDSARDCLSELRQQDPPYDIEGFARGNLALCANSEDANNLQQGFNLAGIEV